METTPSFAAAKAELDRRRLPEKMNAFAQLSLRHFRLFVALAWHITNPGQSLDWNWHLDALCDHLQAVAEGRIRRLLINIPPGHMKSLVTAVCWPAWLWARDPSTQILCATYVMPLALRDSIRCRDLIESEWYRTHFAGGWDMKHDQNAKSFYQNDAKGFRLSMVTGSGTGFRGDGMLVDDPISADEAWSQVAREESIRWWDQTMSSRLNDMRRGWRVIIGQRLHEDDLSGHVLKQGGYEHLCLPSEYDPGRHCRTSIWTDPRTQPGELLFEKRFPRDVLDEARLKDLGSDAYAGQHQQLPVGDKGGIFKLDWFQRYEVPPMQLDEVIQSWDMTFKGTDGTDYVAGQVWGKKGANLYLLDRVCERMSYTQARQAIRELSRKWPAALGKLVEDKANGPAIIDDLRGSLPGLVPIQPEGDKLARAHAVSPLVEAGNVWVPEHASWLGDWLHQVTHFPKAAHDDEVDAMTQALRYLNRVRAWFI